MSNQGWIAEASSLVELATLLGNCMSPEHDVRNNAMDSLKVFESQPEFFNYLCYILIEGETDTTLLQRFSQVDLANCRATAGMLLKNSLMDPSNIATKNIEYVKSNIVKGLENGSNALVGNVTGIVVTALFSSYYRQHRDDPTGWNMLTQLLELSARGSVDAAKALSKVVEDNATLFQLDWTNNQTQSGQPIEILVIQFLLMIDAPQLPFQVRAECIKSINFIIKLQSQYFIVKIDEFLNKLFHLAQTESHEPITTQICISFTLLLETRPDKLIDHLAGIVQFMLHVIGNATNEQVAVEACEFLHTFVTGAHIPKHILQPFVGELAPVLLAKMVYDKDSITIFETHNEADALVEDKDEDIRPMAPRIVKKGKNGTQADTSDDEEEDDDDDGDGQVDSGWTLRKCSAATLDSMTNVLPRDVIEIAFPFLREHLTSEEWYVREATILALGAMAEGGMKYFNDQLPALIPFLVEQLKDTWAPVRKIVCWTLSRFSPWILQDHTEFLIPVLEPIVATLLDNKKDVQEAAISSVAVFIENCDTELIETLLYNDLLQSFDKCFTLYKKKNLIILYDAVGRFAEKVELDDKGMQIVLPHLISKWSALPDNDKELWPLLECLSCVASSLGERFAPMAPEVYSRAYRILCHCVESESKSHNDPTIVVPEKDFTITSLDLIDGIVQALGENAQPLLIPGQTDRTLLQIMLECLQDPVHEVRQSVFALLGDIVTFFDTQVLSGYLSQFLKFIGIEAMHNDDIEGIPSVVNAVWALGIISERIDLAQYIIDLSGILLDLFVTTLQDVDLAILENVAITIGRMGMTHPEVFNTGKFANDAVWTSWCNFVNPVDSIEEKSSAYLGFIKITALSSTVQMSNTTLHKIIEGLSRNVDTSVFTQEVVDFLMSRQQQLSQISFNDHELHFLQSFAS
ncbi:similar to Saccharomyces cerevisiae YBR017C KAP104 Transportin or cytosolic karyopherin beta 2 [Maudiozyma saulgeensis]|uniref:Similar to Saccharomyces cerevisiae YBR017C KAP104 Transportin or cytosolic karyopherin beta 2 n=1 Tax=Maudiozyma saulgeensis TaxID=1789683 RepID=A0A1X7RB82_9SACH|nr:similar to Saccharomyces cerevisiae YBR017C KAP104 Transportin or cytosolic karyopherin beta 2 [Kazachstania saulgeensis]